MKILRFAALAFAGALFFCVPVKAERIDVVSQSSASSFEASAPASSIVAIARRDIGRNPTGNRYLWCMDAVNRWMDKAGYQTTGSRAARSILNHGQRIRRANLRPGDIVFKPRRGGGHVEVFVRWADNEKTEYIAITGNSCGKRGQRYVCEVPRPASRIRAAVRVSRGL